MAEEAENDLFRMEECTGEGHCYSGIHKEKLAGLLRKVAFEATFIDEPYFDNIRLEEREACAKIAEEHGKELWDVEVPAKTFASSSCQFVASRIRAR